jgi:hypothetical protein
MARLVLVYLCLFLSLMLSVSFPDWKCKVRLGHFVLSIIIQRWLHDVSVTLLRCSVYAND